MNLQVRNEIGALFKLVSRKASDDSISNESDWFHNDILDSGLARMSVGTWIDRVCVGTSNTPVNVATQTGLQAFLVSTTTTQGGDATGSDTNPSAPYWWVRRTYRFGEGVAAGNLAEVGLGWSNENTWNRALIRDQNGNPVIFPVLSDEYLDIVSEIRIYPTPSYSGNVNFRDKIGNIISSHTVTGLPLMIAQTFNANKITIGRTAITSGGFSVFSTDIRSMTQKPLTSLSTASVLKSTTYGANSVTEANSIALSIGNGVHRSIYIATSLMAVGNSNGCGYQFQIDPPITKTAEMELTYTFTMSWGRKAI